MAIFNSYVSLPEGKGNHPISLPWFSLGMPGVHLNGPSCDGKHKNRKNALWIMMNEPETVFQLTIQRKIEQGNPTDTII